MTMQHTSIPVAAIAAVARLLGFSSLEEPCNVDSTVLAKSWTLDYETKSARMSGLVPQTSHFTRTAVSQSN